MATLSSGLRRHVQRVLLIQSQQQQYPHAVSAWQMGTSTSMPATPLATIARHVHTTPTNFAMGRTWDSLPPVGATFHQGSFREGEPTKWDKMTFGEKLRVIYRDTPGMLKKETKALKNMVVEHLKDDPERAVLHDDSKIFWSFRTQADVDKFVVTTDATNKGGFSSGGAVLTHNQTVLFYGHLCTEIPKDGQTGLSGYVNFSSPKRYAPFHHERWWDFSMYSHLLIKYRGDGRTYIIVLGSSGYSDLSWADHYNYPLYTCGGPYWQWAKIPFSKFIFAHKGRLQDAQQPVLRDKISHVGFTIMERCDGPFQLEIDYIGGYHNAHWTEKHAYEMYVTRKYEAQC